MPEQTAQEAAQDRSAEEIEQDMIEDFNLFQEWFAEVFIAGPECAQFHEYLIYGHIGIAGGIAGLAWEEHCKTEANKQTGE